MEKRINLSITEIIKLAKDNPKGTQLTSEVKEYVDEKGNKITEFNLLA